MAIARKPTTVIDCPDIKTLANFYGSLLGWPVTIDDEDWATVRSENGDGALAFQQVEGDYQAPEWPGQNRPQQLHLDFKVDDLDEGEKAALDLGATLAETQPGTNFRVFLDPAGHPFCLCLS